MTVVTFDELLGKLEHLLEVLRAPTPDSEGASTPAEDTGPDPAADDEDDLGDEYEDEEDDGAARRAMLTLAGLIPRNHVARELAPWSPTPKLGPGSTMADVNHVVGQMLAKLGDNKVVDIEDRFTRCLGPEATPAEALLLTHIVGMSDGYNTVWPIEDWPSRSTTGWHTSVAFRPELDGAQPSFGFETRHNGVAKQLAVFIDTQRPGERLPEKLRIETALVARGARGARVMSISANDVLVDGASSAETIETILGEISDEVLFEDGQIDRPWVRPDRR